jgi:hypothetical protein
MDRRTSPLLLCIAMLLCIFAGTNAATGSVYVQKSRFSAVPLFVFSDDSFCGESC